MAGPSGSFSRRRAFWIAAIVAAAVAVAHALARPRAPGMIHGLAQIELELLDLDERARAWLNPPGPPDGRLVLVGLDDRSAARAGRFTSEPDFYAELLSRIAEAKPRVLVLDYLLQNRLISTDLVGQLGQLKQDLITRGAGDTETLAEFGAIKASIDVEARLDRALGAAPSLVPFACDPEQRPADAEMDAALFSKAWTIENADTEAQSSSRFLSPIPSLVAAASAVAQTCERMDADGVLRSDLAVIATERGDQQLLLPSLSVVAAAMTEGVGSAGISVSPARLAFGSHSLPTDNQGRLFIDFGGGTGSFRARARLGTPTVYSASDVLEGLVKADRFAGKTVLVGSLRPNQRDAKRTPFVRADADSRMPGLERVAIEIDSILSGRPIPRRPPWADRFGFMITAILGALGAMAATRLRPITAMGLALLGAVVVIGGVMLAYAFGAVWIDGAYPALAALLPTGAGVLLVYSVEQEEKRHLQEDRRFLQDAFSLYVAPELVNEILEDRAIDLKGEERELTILFADLRNFTSSSSTMPAPEIVRIVNEHFTAMADVILRHGGTLDKFIGDAVMAFWNAPVADAEHAQHATAAALEMLRVLDEMNVVRAGRGEPPQEMGVGLATGRVVVGNVGARDRRFNYTAIGDAVNVASRLEGLTKTSDYGILVGEETRAKCGDAFGFVELGSVPVKGKDGGVVVFAVASSRRVRQRSAGTG